MLVPWLWLTPVLVLCSAEPGASLRGAVEALQRRQRSTMRGPVLPSTDYDAVYEFVPPGYPEPDYDTDVDESEEQNPEILVRLLDDVKHSPNAYEYKVIKKKNSRSDETNARKQSAFRERNHHAENERLRDLFADTNDAEAESVNDLFQDKFENDAEYALLLGQLWSKYKNDKVHNLEQAPQGIVKLYKDKIIKKRYSDNWGPIAFKRKRSSDSDADHSISSDYESDRKGIDTLASNYNTDDDKDDWREEYAIAFQPLEDDAVPDLNDNDRYTYDTMEKRFPVTKRSSGPYEFNNQKKRFVQNRSKLNNAKTFRSSSGTDPRILKDLSRIFGESDLEIIKNPVKRSTDHETHSHDGKPPLLAPLSNTTHESNNTTHHDDESHEQHGHSLHHPGMSGTQTEHTHNHNNEHHDKPIVVRKKSIDWSDYFGIDKRSKSALNQDRLRKQYFDTFNKEVIYPLNSFRKHSYAKRNYVKTRENDETELSLDNRQASPKTESKRNTETDNESKLDNIDKKLKNMEGLIVDEALHYSEVGEELDSKEEQEMKEKLLSRLAAAYSLEKMRKALKEFKQSLQIQKSDSKSKSSAPSPIDEAKAKRVVIKKEKLEMRNNEIPAFKALDNFDDFEDEQGAGHYLNGKIEPQFSEGYMGGSGRHRIPVVSAVDVGATGSCPVLAKIVQRCRGVDLLAGDRGQLFLPLCSLHQICYLCGEAPPTTCDLVFLSEADTTCDGDMGCQRAARSALMALRELHDNLADELDGECEASPCLPATLKLNIGWQHALQR